MDSQNSWQIITASYLLLHLYPIYKLFMIIPLIPSQNPSLAYPLFKNCFYLIRSPLLHKNIVCFCCLFLLQVRFFRNVNHSWVTTGKNKAFKSQLLRKIETKHLKTNLLLKGSLKFARFSNLSTKHFSTSIMKDPSILAALFI